MNHTRPALRLTRRWRQLDRIVRAEGWGSAWNRARRSLAERIVPSVSAMPVRPADVVLADLGEPFVPRVPRVESGQPIVLNWIAVPAGAGSGGHTTLYRMVNHLQSRGYRNRVYFYDTNHADLAHYAAILRSDYRFEGEIASVDDGMADSHAVVATSWPTAYAAFNARCTGKRFYFVQDFEPDFHAVGAARVLAGNTYRMGLHAITAGRWLAAKLEAEYGMAADAFEFGCDVGQYRRTDGARSAIAYYARPEVARRGFELGVMALAIFARRRPDIQIHLYGDKVGSLPFPFLDHGRVTPAELNRIYNASFAGLSLSLTNVSLVPYEMLASGCIPVVNEAVQNRMVLDNPFVQYATLDPHDIAAALESVVAMPAFDAHSRRAAESVGSVTWERAGDAIDSIFRRTLGA